MAEQRSIMLAALSVSETTGKNKQILRVFQSPEGMHYTQFSDGSMEADIPTLQVKRGGYLSYTYNPAEMVYTGATSGNIHMGGFHMREASYSERRVSSDRGYIQVTTRCGKFMLRRVTVPPEIQARFRRDPEMNALVSSGSISCVENSDAGNTVRSMMTGRENGYETIQLMSIAKDKEFLDYDRCQRIVQLLKRILRGDYPPTAEELYNQAMILAKSKESQKLQQAMEMLQSIAHYRDSSSQVDTLKGALEEALRREEKRAEKKRVDAPKVLVRIVLLAMLLIFAVSVLIEML